MLKFTKILFASVLMVCTMVATSVGHCAKAPKYGADKAILAYTEAYAFGSPSDSRYIGLTKNDIAEIKRQINAKIAGDFEEFCLSEDSVNKLTDVYVKKIKSEMDIKTAIKEKSKVSPVVSLTATILDSEALDKQAKSDKNLQALLSSIATLRSQGKTEGDLLKDTNLQKKSVDSLTNFIKGLSIYKEKSLSVKCKQITGEDEKLYWAPVDPETLMNFVLGK